MKQPMSYIKFIIPSLIGIFFFLTPINYDGETTIPIAILANFLKNFIGEPTIYWIIMIIIVVSALLSILVSFGAIKTKNELMNSVFNVSVIWVIIRVLAAIFSVLVLFQIGPNAIISEDTGGLLFTGLLPTLLTIFFFAGLFLPLLLNYGLIEFVGTLFTKVMRPLFTLPGRSTVDNLASWVGDGTVGVILTSQQYEKGYYSLREATVIATTFSVVSITFTIVVLQEINLMNYFGIFYGTIILCGIVCALIMPRIPPLSLVKDTYYVEGVALNEEIPKNYNIFSWGLKKALGRARNADGVVGYLKDASKTIVEMLFVVLPVVMAVGTLGTILAEETPIFQWIGAPFVPILEFARVPEAARAAETLFVGFIDMFLPSIFISDVEVDKTRFIVGALSITQLIYLSEVGGVILGSKIPVNILNLFIIFVLRTIISLPIIIVVAHLVL